jgi:hypothetical protein
LEFSIGGASRMMGEFISDPDWFADFKTETELAVHK